MVPLPFLSQISSGELIRQAVAYYTPACVRDLFSFLFLTNQSGFLHLNRELHHMKEVEARHTGVRLFTYYIYTSVFLAARIFMTPKGVTYY